MFTQFVGAPCGQHGQYTFYKAFKYYKHGKYKILTMGEFFFVRISPSDDPCIGELQLLWEDRCNDQVLSSMRLYFLPEQTPDGRHPHHGEHEVLAVSDKVVLRLEDLVHWITDEVEWSHGLQSTCQKDTTPCGDVAAGLEAIPGLEGVETSRAEQLSRTFFDQTGLDIAEVYEEKEQLEKDQEEEDEDEEGEERKDEKSTETAVVVLSYPRYCRYRAMLRRVCGVENVWLRSAIVVAVGGFSPRKHNTRVLFCRDTFEHENLLQNDLNCEHLAPNLKSRPKKPLVSGGAKEKPKKVGRSASPESESNASDEIKENNAKVHLDDATKNGKKPVCKDEQDFLQHLFKFMQERNTPIHRVPHLGFKQIDLYFFYNYAQKLGGYEKITCKKLWKHIYDEMGGNPGSTSAATCTRRHYERLLLPFERYTNGEDDKPLPIVPAPRNRSKKAEEPSSEVKSEPFDGDDEEGEKQESIDEIQGNSEVDLTSIVKKEPELALELSIPHVPPMDASNMNESALLEKESNWTEKEKRWNEIRRKNALERNWARQMRPVKATANATEKESVKPVPELQPPKLYSLAAIQSSLQAKMSNKAAKSDEYKMPFLSNKPLSSYKRTAFPMQHDASRTWTNNGATLTNGSTRLADHINDSLPQPRPSVIQHTEKMQSGSSQPLPAHTSNKMTELYRLQMQRQPFGNKISDYVAVGRPSAHKVPVSGLAFPKNGTHRLDEQLSFCRKSAPPPQVLTSEGSAGSKRVTNSYYYSHVSQCYPGMNSKGTCKTQLEYGKQSNLQRGPMGSSLPTALAPSTPSFSKRVCPPSPCEAEVLDLSTKRKATTSVETNGQLVSSPQHHSNPDVEGLDLTVKKRKVVIDLSDEARGIENVTPPSPISQDQSDHKPIILPPMKSPPIVSLSLLRSAASEKRVPANLIPLVDTKPPFAGGVPMVNPGSKSPFVSEYNPPLPHFMSPHIYPVTSSLWSSGQGIAQNNVAGHDGFQASLSAYKEMVDRGMFQGQQLPYPFAPQMYPVMYKDGHTFPSYSK